MTITNIDLTNSSLSMHKPIVDQCKEIINENHQDNGGTLKVSNIFEKDYDWTNLIVVVFEGKVVGFALVRSCNNTHGLDESIEYYYLSDIVVKTNYQGTGIGTALMKYVASYCKDKPLVASCLKDNDVSIRLLSKFMTSYGTSDSGKYLRFIDNNSYTKLFSGVTNGTSNINDNSSYQK